AVRLTIASQEGSDAGIRPLLRIRGAPTAASLSRLKEVRASEGRSRAQHPSDPHRSLIRSASDAWQRHPDMTKAPGWSPGPSCMSLAHEAFRVAKTRTERAKRVEVSLKNR